jgi:hypothetical protein
MSMWTCFEHLRRFPASSMPTVNVSAAERRATDDAMSWLRNNDPNLDDVDFATAQAHSEPCWCEMPSMPCQPCRRNGSPR